MAVVEAKSKIRLRHKSAITAYLQWEKENPKATRTEKLEMFDFLIDTAASVNITNVD